jgi:glycosyltransferase involved in cell wall biosynthesis
MRIVALVKSPEHVCCRYRVAAFRGPLERAGHRLDIRAWPSFWLSRLLLYRHLQQADVVLVQRKLLPAWQLRLIRRRVRWLIYDFDDAIFLRNSYDPRGHDSPVRSHRFDEMVRQADVVVAGNEFLREQAAPVTSPKRIHVIPTCVDVSRYPQAQHAPDQRPVQLAWIGSINTIKGLERLTPVLEALGKTVAGLQLKVICDRSLTLQHLDVSFVPWSEGTEGAELAGADIGISWLPDDPWSRGKCGLKVLQYMAAGLPVVANPVGMQAQLVRHGETGLLVRTAAEWADAIRRLAADPALRRAMGRAGRSWVEKEYDVRLGAARWLELLDRLQGRAQPRQVLPRAG